MDGDERTYRIRTLVDDLTRQLPIVDPAGAAERLAANTVNRRFNEIVNKTFDGGFECIFDASYKSVDFLSCKCYNSVR